MTRANRFNDGLEGDRMDRAAERERIGNPDPPDLPPRELGEPSVHPLHSGLMGVLGTMGYWYFGLGILAMEMPRDRLPSIYAVLDPELLPLAVPAGLALSWIALVYELFRQRRVRGCFDGLFALLAIPTYVLTFSFSLIAGACLFASSGLALVAPSAAFEILTHTALLSLALFPAAFWVPFWLRVRVAEARERSRSGQRGRRSPPPFRLSAPYSWRLLVDRRGDVRGRSAVTQITRKAA